MNLLKPKQIEGYEEDKKRLEELINDVRKNTEETKIHASRVKTEITKSDGEKYNLENLLEDIYLDNVDAIRTVVPIPTVNDTKKIFNTKVQSPTISDYNKDIIDITGDCEAVDYGEYTFGFSLKNKANYIWEDNTIGVKKFTWKIDKLPINIPDVYDKVKTYNGSEQSPEIIVYDKNAVVVRGDTSSTEVGSKTILFELASDNYIWEDNTTGIKTDTWEITSASLDEPIEGSLNNPEAKTLVYNGKIQTPDFVYNQEEIIIGGDTSAVNAGTYNIYFKLKDPEKYKWSDGTTADKPSTWTILPKTIFIPTVFNTDKIYDGKEQRPYISYNDEYIAMTGTSYATSVGEYEIKFTLINSNYIWSNKTTAPLVYTWKIMAKTVEIPVVKNINIQYTGEEIGPEITYDKNNSVMTGTYKATESGTYTVVFTLKDSNQIWEDETSKPKAFTWSIDRIEIPSEYSSFSQNGKLEYNKKEQSPTIKGFNSDYCNITGNVEIEPGTYIATITPKNGYKWSDGTISSKTCLWTINKKQLTIPSLSNDSYTYDGSIKAPTINNLNEAFMEKGGVYSTSEGGTHSVTITLYDPDRYIWNDNTTGTKSLPWTISPKVINIPTLSGKSKTYTGSSQSPTISTFNTNEVKQTGTTSAIDVGTYTVTWNLTNTANYIWSDKTISAKSDTWTISTKMIDIPILSNISKTYTGSSQSPTISSFDSNEIIQSGTTLATNVGTYTVSWELKNIAYKWSDGTTGKKSSIWTISPKAVTIPTLTNSSKTYTGSSQSPTINNYNSTYMTQSGTSSATGVGTYTITWTLSNSNYKWSDGTTTNKSASWSINKLAGSLTLSSTSISLDSENKAKTVTVTRSGTGAITVTSSNISIATVSISGTTITITAVATGSCTITVSVAGDSNYNAPDSKSISVSCQMVPTLNQSEWSDISAKAQAGNADLYYDIGDTKRITLNGKIGYVTEFNNEAYDVYILDINKKINGKADNNIILGGFIKPTNNSMYKYVVLADYIGRNYKNSIKMEQQWTNFSGRAYFNMNHSYSESTSALHNGNWTPGYYGTNWGGWKGCDLRYDILGATSKPPSMYGNSKLKTISNVGYNATQATITSPVANTLMAALPSDFRSILKLWTRYGNVKGSDYRSSAIGTYTDAITIPLLSDIATLDQYKTNATYQANGCNEVANTYKGELNGPYEVNEYEFNYNEPLKFFANGNPTRRYTNGSDGQSYDTIVEYWLATTYCNGYVKEHKLDPTKHCLKTDDSQYRFFTMSGVSTNYNNISRNIILGSMAAFLSSGVFPMFKI